MERIVRHALVAIAFLVAAGWSASEARATTLVFVHGQNTGKHSVDYITNKYLESRHHSGCDAELSGKRVDRELRLRSPIRSLNSIGFSSPSCPAPEGRRPKRVIRRGLHRE